MMMIPPSKKHEVDKTKPGRTTYTVNVNFACYKGT